MQLQPLCCRRSAPPKSRIYIFLSRVPSLSLIHLLHSGGSESAMWLLFQFFALRFVLLSSDFFLVSSISLRVLSCLAGDSFSTTPFSLHFGKSFSFVSVALLSFPFLILHSACFRRSGSRSAFCSNSSLFVLCYSLFLFPYFFHLLA